MRRGSYRVVEYGGRHSGCTSTRHTSDELVLDREDIAYVMKVLRRGSEDDKAFAKKMFGTLCPHIRCDCCGGWISLADADEDRRGYHLMYDKRLCGKCWHIMSDIDYIRGMKKYGCKSDPLDMLKSVQKAREEWCPHRLNYLVNAKTYGRCAKKYKELFGKDIEKE